ncbi:hypothetical protein ACFWYW_20225 [Nonomuraea sp. NPDC059023]|uniref:hypothetical protein n=1 Tax=Nonomuraea sp. NPDC059023 TaxID=3346706 RepID=UPI0036C5AAAD
MLGHRIGASIVIVLSECFSPHVAPAQERYTQIGWRGAVDREDRVRVVAWTCDCRSTVYELCHAGGQAHTRRTSRKKAEPGIHETFRWTFNDADKLWAALLRGKAR